jgi:hypothetical protein
MGEFRTGSREDGDLSWTNEALPLEVRRALLDKALADFKASKAAGKTRSELASTRDRAATPDRAGQSGSDRDSTSKKDKPQA